MTEGLITRIGRWIDEKWKVKATEEMVMEHWNNLENAQIRDKLEIEKRFNDIAANHYKLIQDLQNTVKKMADFLDQPREDVKELADMKTRLEKIELYSGMTRKVDPTKPPVVKSAFQM